MKPKLIYVVTEDWYFCSHRLTLACAARDAGFDVLVVTRAGSQASRIRSEGFRLVHLDMRRGKLGPINAISTVFQLRQIFINERPAIVHNVAIKPVILGTIAARISGIDAIVNALAGLGYAFASSDLKALILRPVLKLIFRSLFRYRSVHLVVQNSADADIVSRLAANPQKVTLIPGSGVDMASYMPKPEAPGSVIVSIVSRMLWDKGVGDLIEAARILRRGNHDIQICLVGPTDPENPSNIPEKTLLAWAKEGIVKWLGPIEDINSVWERSHIAVLPSYREGLPKSLLEAAAAGRALIATDVPGCRDIVVHGETGLLVPPRDPVALSNAIIQLSENSELRKKFGRAARARTESLFRKEIVIDKTILLYQSIN